uniref:Uncharacterized protein n=1 Tax=Octopus bimaculoides TaxID=37653 RepID=A0A0L8G1I2_OCTBM
MLTVQLKGQETVLSDFMYRFGISFSSSVSFGLKNYAISLDSVSSFFNFYMYV